MPSLGAEKVKTEFRGILRFDTQRRCDYEGGGVTDEG